MSNDKQPRWIICPTCQGEGTSSAHLGAIPAEEFHNEWAPEEQEAYLRGDYDTTCERCGGSGKVRDEPEAERDYAWESESMLRAMGG